MKTKILLVLLIVIAAGIGLAVIFAKTPQDSVALDAFAQCIRDKTITMYGADWCPHCQNEKKAFGDSFRFVPYVECPDDPKRCLAVGIAGFPTWILPDGEKLEGEQGLKKLSAESGCQLPESN